MCIRDSVFDAQTGKTVSSGPFRQVSRLGNPLINEVIIPLGEKDLWNHLAPVGDKKFAQSYAQPELAALLPPLYPGVFPNLAALVASGKARADLEAILLTGIPSGIIPGFQNNTGPITALDSANWNSRQFYTVRKVGPKGGDGTVLGANLPCPPCNIGPLSTPNYAKLAAEALHDLGNGVKVFAGQRAEGFYVDLGSIFDLANLRPFQNLHEQYGMHVFTKPAPGVNATNRLNVHSIAIQVPITDLSLIHI